MWGIPVPSRVPAGGLGWGRAIRSGFGVPADALGNLGDRYFDTTAQRWYLKRWVANREGVGDSILYPINLFPRVGDFEFSVLVRLDAVPDARILFFASSPNKNQVAEFRIEAGVSVPSYSLRNSAGIAQYSSASSVDLGQIWRCVTLNRAANILTLGVDGVSTSGVDTSSWAPSLTQTGTFALATSSTASSPIKCCKLRLTGPGGSIISNLDEGTGTTINNEAGANGILTDGSPMNFWFQAWVPMDLL